MASKTVYSPGPDYRHLVGSRVLLVLESEQTVSGTIRDQVESSVRGDNLLLALDTSIVSPAGDSYRTVLIAARASSLLVPGQPVSVYVSVPSGPEPRHFKPATNGLLTII